MSALHKECLTRRYLFHHLQLLEGLLGFGLGRLGSFKGRRELGRSRLRVKLQTLMFFHESLKLLLHLADLGLKFLSLGALHGHSLFGLGHRLLEGRHLRRGPYNKQYNLVIFCNCIFFIYFSIRYLLPSFSSSCRLARPSSCSVRSRPYFRAPTSAVSVAVASSEACICVLTPFC